MGVMATKIIRLLKAQGPGAVLRRSIERVGDLRRLKRALARERTFATTDELLDFVEGPDGRFARPFQVRWEIASLLEKVRTLSPKRILEIGTANGGTLLLWTRVAAADARLISLDLPGGNFGDGYPAWKSGLYKSFALPGQAIELVRGDSHKPESLEKVKALLKGESLDFLFIDGDHSYEGAKADFETYSPLVRPGGLIALHDVAPHTDSTCQVDRLWNELILTRKATPLIAQPPQGWAGIGVVEI